MQIYLLLTEKCNLSCKMCIRGKQVGNDLSFDTLKMLLSRDQALMYNDIVITGGEPTLHPYFIDITKYMCRYSKTVTITTNGILNYYVDHFYHIDNVLFQVSVDGDEMAHDEIRGRGSYYKTMETINLFSNKKIPFAIASVVNQSNQNAMFNLGSIIEKFDNLLHWKLSYEMPFGDANWNESLGVEEWNNFVDTIISKTHCKILIKKMFAFSLYDRYWNQLNAIKNSKRLLCNNCGSVKNKIYIYPNFNVYPCTCLQDFCIGNLESSDLNEILNSNIAKCFSNYEIRKDSLCYSCKYKLFCNGGCIGMSYHYFGKLGVGDIRCPRIKKEI